MKFSLIGIKITKKIIRKKKNNKAKKKNNKIKKKNNKIKKGGAESSAATISQVFKNKNINPSDYSRLNFTKEKKSFNYYLKDEQPSLDTKMKLITINGNRYEIHTIPSSLIDITKFKTGEDLSSNATELKNDDTTAFFKKMSKWFNLNLPKSDDAPDSDDPDEEVPVKLADLISKIKEKTTATLLADWRLKPKVIISINKLTPNDKKTFDKRFQKYYTDKDERSVDDLKVIIIGQDNIGDLVDVIEEDEEMIVRRNILGKEANPIEQMYKARDLVLKINLIKDGTTGPKRLAAITNLRKLKTDNNVLIKALGKCGPIVGGNTRAAIVAALYPAGGGAIPLTFTNEDYVMEYYKTKYRANKPIGAAGTLNWTGAQLNAANVAGAAALQNLFNWRRAAQTDIENLALDQKVIFEDLWNLRIRVADQAQPYNAGTPVGLDLIAAINPAFDAPNMERWWKSDIARWVFKGYEAINPDGAPPATNAAMLIQQGLLEVGINTAIGAAGTGYNVVDPRVTVAAGHANGPIRSVGDLDAIGNANQFAAGSPPAFAAAAARAPGAKPGNAAQRLAGRTALITWYNLPINQNILKYRTDSAGGAAIFWGSGVFPDGTQRFGDFAADTALLYEEFDRLWNWYDQREEEDIVIDIFAAGDIDLWKNKDENKIRLEVLKRAATTAAIAGPPAPPAPAGRTQAWQTTVAILPVNITNAIREKYAEQNKLIQEILPTFKPKTTTGGGRRRNRKSKKTTTSVRKHRSIAQTGGKKSTAPVRKHRSIAQTGGKKTTTSVRKHRSIAQTGGKKSSAPVRKHRAITQIGGNKGRLRKGYRYSGKKLKSGLPEIIKCKSKKC